MISKKFSIVIPARLNSLRFKNKIIVNIFNLPMIEHVRRRAEKSKINKKSIFVVTNNKRIEKIVNTAGGNILKSKKKHINGTSRVAEIVNRLKTEFIIILQGDEPLIRPSDINKIVQEIIKYPSYNVYNTVTNLKKNEFNDKSVVKCIINNKKEILDFFRYKKKINKKNQYKKIQGILIFKKEVLSKYSKLIKSSNEIRKSIEQFRFLDNNFKIKTINLKKSTQSVNYIKDLGKVINILKEDSEQKKIYNSLV
tara:strand:+ start:4306 stop:5064 length:759 start_codon:yes stop_codon:yes gene_type:complete